jgi:hypothetical protein
MSDQAKGGRAIGFQITSTWCLDCAPEGVKELYPAMREGDDQGVPYDCDICCKALTPTEDPDDA